MGIFSKLFSPGKMAQPVDYAALKTDFHSHLIPGIDDGSDSLETSTELIRAFSELGYRKLITTPHVQGEFYKNGPNNILPGLEQVRRELKKQKVDMQIEAAAEYLIDDRFEEKYKNGRLLTFGKNHVLVEFSFFNEHPRWKDFIFDLQIEGYKVILAHPERYSYWFRSWDKYRELKDRGVLFQVNIVSLTGYYSQEVKKVAERLIDDEMIDFAGSDMHNMHYMEALRAARYEKAMHRLVESGRLQNHTL